LRDTYQRRFQEAGNVQLAEFQRRSLAKFHDGQPAFMGQPAQGFFADAKPGQDIGL